MHISGQNQCYSMLWEGWDWGFSSECPIKVLIFCSYLAGNSKIWGNLGERNLFVNIFFFQMPMFLNFLPIISIKLKFMQCAIMAFFKARLWWCFVILWRLFKSYWTFFLTKSCLKYLIIIYLLSKYYYLIPGTLRRPFKNRSDSYEPPCTLYPNTRIFFRNHS